MKILITDLKKAFRASDGSQIVVIDHLDLSIRSQEIHCVIGPSGCGKTTLLRLVAGLDNPDGGSIKLNEAGPSEARVDGSIGVAFQSPGLMPWRTVEDNIALPFDLRRIKRDGQQISILLNLSELTSAAGLLPSQLSGGMAHRVSLCRALVLRPSLLLLDEPFANLDWSLRRRLLVDLKRLLGENQSTVLFVTHDVREAAFLADRISILSSKPARIAKTLDVQMAANDGMDSFSTEAFHHLCDRIQEEADASK